MSLSIDGPKTLNGLITEYMEMIPETGTSLLLDNHPIDIVQIKDNMVKTVRIHKLLENHALNVEVRRDGPWMIDLTAAMRWAVAQGMIRA